MFCSSGDHDAGRWHAYFTIIHQVGFVDRSDHDSMSPLLLDAEESSGLATHYHKMTAETKERNHSKLEKKHGELEIIGPGQGDWTEPP
jgi:hypothetical protein